ncbi:hypothetical protein N8600_02065 [Gammaproteobacteria bacterium]|nr:hypothetical protein [Gammaproteobacteria bacterium]
MADSDFDNIKPADINLTGKSAPAEQVESAAVSPPGGEEIRRSDEEKKKQSKILGGIFFLLLVLVAGVIFVLPRLISPPDPTTSSVVVVNAPSNTAAAANSVAPFEEAQKLRQRETAQNILAELLDLQESLEEKEVASWAETEINSVFALASQGDEAYQSQDFIGAATFYQQGLEILSRLDVSLPDVFSRYLATGEQAILNDDPALAEESFSIAILVNPDSAEAVNGYDRAQLLTEVLGVIAQGRQFHDAGEFESARELYRQALAIDPVHVGAGALLERANTDILDRDFSAAMSQGFSALASNAPETAETAFKQALALKPQSPEARSALEQTVDQITLSAINIHLDAATAFESQEQWQPALTEYDEALAIDGNVVSAREGRNRANSRNNLDNYLETINNDPLRLAENAVYEQAIGIYNEAAKIEGNWPRLNAQLNTLRNFIQRATEPVEVILQSDALTDVTVYQVGSLGQFTSHTLNLEPGTYVAVGIREGFRDVREEFVVGFDGKPPIITVQCVEEIL